MKEKYSELLFLPEDKKYFIKVLPEWLKYVNFLCERVPDIKFVEDRNYGKQFMLSELLQRNVMFTRNKEGIPQAVNSIGRPLHPCLVRMKSAV